jgi:glycosyltransferase involved in cell wall biosynthesis
MEIILVNDGSDDGSEKLCHEYAKNDSRIRVIDQVNKGVVSAKKKGVLAANGDFIGYVDSDDYIDADYFQKMMKLQTEHQTDMVAVGHFHEIGNRAELQKNAFLQGHYLFGEIAEKALYTGIFFEYGIGPHLCTKIFRADLVKQVQNIPENIRAGDDAAVVYPCLAKSNGIYISDMAGYHYVQHMGSVTKVSCTQEEKRIDALVEYLKQSMKNAGYEQEFSTQLEMYRKYLLVLRDIAVFDIGKDTLLTPFGGLHSGERIVLYGAGVLGQKIYRYLKNDGRIIITAWLDRNYESYRASGLDVDSPEKLRSEIPEYNYILIANITEKTVESIKKYLLSMKIAENKIRWFSDEFRGK